MGSLKHVWSNNNRLVAMKVPPSQALVQHSNCEGLLLMCSRIVGIPTMTSIAIVTDFQQYVRKLGGEATSVLGVLSEAAKVQFSSAPRFARVRRKSLSQQPRGHERYPVALSIVESQA